MAAENHFEIIEGFICPICLEDCGNISQLQIHFEENHQIEEKSTLPSFKGIITNKIIKMRNPFSSEENCEEISINDPWDWQMDNNVPSKIHSSVFKKIRNDKIDSFIADTNKLLIRLDKILSSLPTDTNKRKAREKEIVQWVDDKDVPLCPFCAKSFMLTRRRHHCRLCGAIMCSECSQALSFSYAEKLISPVHHGDSKPPQINQSENSSSGAFGSIIGSIPGLRRSNSHGSLNSIFSISDSANKEKALRVCSHCLQRLDGRQYQVDKRTAKTLLSVYYDRLMQHRNQLNQHIPQFEKMSQSLAAGESTYNLSDAETLRHRILKISDSMSMTAQKINNLGAAGVAFSEPAAPLSPDGEKIPPYPKQEILQKRIHSASVSFLKDSVLCLPKLPTNDELKRLKELKRVQELKRREAEERAKAEKEAAKTADEKSSQILSLWKRDESRDKSNLKSKSPNQFSSPRFDPSRSTEFVVHENGWGADISDLSITETDDPLVQQMNLIRGYIKQARDAVKYDEVSILESNLKELQIEYKKQLLHGEKLL